MRANGDRSAWNPEPETLNPEHILAFPNMGQMNNFNIKQKEIKFKIVHIFVL